MRSMKARIPVLEPASIDDIGRRHVAGPVERSPTAMITGLQRAVGNQVVARELARRRSLEIVPGAGGLPVIQRCGPSECDCSSVEKSEYLASHPDDKGFVQGLENQDERPGASVQRHAAASVKVQRHAGFRTKPRLEVPELQPLQFASSRTDRALEFGRAGNELEVRRLQEGLRKAGRAEVPVNGIYDEATKAAVARFQQDHGIPFPTGLQAGPKTLSTLDDHLLGGPKPNPKCTQYEPLERQKSFGSGEVSGAETQQLRLFNFAAGVELMKFDHQQALLAYVRAFDLANPDPCTREFVVDSVTGLTDPIDSEADNANLRMERAFQVSDFLHSHGVPAAPDGEPGGPSTVCTPRERTLDRAVVIRLKRAPRPPREQCERKPPLPNPKDPDDPCKATRWQIRVKPLGLSVPKLPAGITGLVLFAELTMLRSDQQPRTADLFFSGGGQGLSTPNPIPLSVCTETVAPFQTFSPKGFSDFQGAGLNVFLNIHIKNVSQLALPPATNPAAIDTSGFCFPPSLSEGTVPGRWQLGFNPCPTKEDVQ